MKTFSALALGMSWILVPAGYAANVIINEIMAAPSERLVRWPTNGVARVGTGVAWQEPAFDSSGWASAPSPFGYGFADIQTDLEQQMRGITPSLYVRIHFSVSAEQATSGDPLTLIVDYDDGYAAYLNGREIARRNLGGPGAFVYHDQPAFNPRFGSGPESVAVGPASNWLRTADNLLAIQVHDRGRASDVSFKFDGSLQVESERPVVLIPAGAAWKYFVGVCEPSGGAADPSVSGNPEFCDWIELCNRGGESVSLDGWALSDRANDTNRWTFPAITLPAGGYLLVLASGEDVRDPHAPYLHTNFKLDAEGEFLGLFDNFGQLVDQLGAPFPRQVFTHSYGRDQVSASQGYFEEPSPGKQNVGTPLLGVLTTPVLSHPPGFYTGPVQLSITSAESDSLIRYTTNGSEPTLISGTLYSGPIELSESTALRARAFKEGWVPSDTITRTFLINEPDALQSMPAVSVVADPERSLYLPHGVTAIVGGTWLGAPWRPLGPADYNMPMEQGRPYERPASLEIILLSPGQWRQIPVGLRTAGSAATRSLYRLPFLWENPWYGPWEEKPSFNLFLRNEYGIDRIDFPLVPGYDEDTFHSLKVRSGKVDWNNPFLVDEMMRRIFVDMGQVGSMGLLANLFVNGQFKCYYNLAERVNEDFLQERHRSDQPWDIIADNVAEEGDAQAWSFMLDFIRTNDMRLLDHYQTASQQLDMVNFIDYLLVNIYGGHWDWPHRNYVAARERLPQAPYRFYVWDIEAAMDTARVDPATYDVFLDRLRVAASYPVSDLYKALSISSEFRLLFADRIQKHFFHGGALTEENLRARLEELATPLDPSMQWVRDGTPVDRARLTTWIELRRTALFAQFRRENLWPSTLAPVFNQQGGEVIPGFEAELTNPNPGGTLYFTIDGSDPRNPDNSPHGTVYTEPITVETMTIIKARVLGNAEWSPLAEATFTVPSAADLIITEIMYHPPDSGDISGTRLEFIELRNVGDTVAHLDGFQFTDGITYTFPLGTPLASGEYLVLASDTVAFANHYGGLEAFDQFEGNLENAGERIALSDPTGRETLAFTYDDQPPWPTSPDGYGYSLVLVNEGRITDANDPANWRASLQTGGSPWKTDSATILISITPGGTGVVLTWDNSWVLQTSGDLKNWADLPGAVSPLTVSISATTNRFWRSRMPQASPPEISHR